jgi:hypothetical protein
LPTSRPTEPCLRVLIATPVDFRRGADGLTALVRETLRDDSALLLLGPATPTANTSPDFNTATRA